MSFFRNKPVFGRKGTGPSAIPSSSSRQALMEGPPVDSDGKKRIFGERIYETHGDFLRLMGRDINDPENILPTEEDHQRALQKSVDDQKSRHAALEAELSAKHGEVFIWPYHIFGDPVWNGPDGLWLMRVMKLLPGDGWNILYLASNRDSSNKIGLPIHPGSGISFVDEKVQAQIKKFRIMFDDLMSATDPIRKGDFDSELLNTFAERKQSLHDEILAFSAFMRERLLEMLWKATRETS